MASTTTPKNTLLGGTNYEPRLRSYSKPQRFKLVEKSLRMDSFLNQTSPLATRFDVQEPERFETTASDLGKMARENPKESEFAPQNVRKVLRFQSYYVENVDESNLEVVRLRKNIILLYLHDETFEIIEPRVRNSGIPQGMFLKRCQLCRPDGEVYSSADLHLGVDLYIFGRSFKLYDCDKFTREYYARNGKDVGQPLSLPQDEYTLTRDQITRMCGGDPEHFYGKQRYPLKTYMEASLGNPIRSRLQSEKKRKFLANNRKVLCFRCEYDVRNQPYGDLMSYTLDYFLEDDTMEFKEVACSNNGRAPFPLLLCRARLLKNWHQHLTDEQDRGVEEPSGAEGYYSETDLYVGAVLDVFGRAMRLVDADKYTRDYYKMAWGCVLEPAIPTNVDTRACFKPEPPPYNGYGTEEDSLGSCHSLCPTAPRKNFKQMDKFDRMVLRFRARMIASGTEQQQRRFIVSYFLTDDTMSIYEPELRNSGIVNGKFLERGAYKDPEGVRYSLKHLVTDAELVFNSHRFHLLDPDEYTKKFLAANKPLVVGVIFPPKKIARLQELLDEKNNDIRFVLIDLDAATPTGNSVTDADLEAAAERFAVHYGPLDALLHKLAHEMVFAKLGNKDASNRMQLMHHYLRHHPSVRVVDSIESVRLLTDRYEACMMLQRMEQKHCDKSQQFKVPRFQVVKNVEQFQNLVGRLEVGHTRLPLICKSVEACATDRSHMMSVVTKREDLQYVGYPILYQEFINHSSRLFKGYVLGDTIYVAERRSLPNLVAGLAQQVHFDTQQKYPSSKDFHPHVDECASKTDIDDAMAQHDILAAVRAIGTRLRRELKLTLFGFDVIVADGSSDLYVIDVNYFPSYRELDNLSGALRKHIKQSCCRRKDVS